MTLLAFSDTDFFSFTARKLRSSEWINRTASDGVTRAACLSRAWSTCTGPPFSQHLLDSSTLWCPKSIDRPIRTLRTAGINWQVVGNARSDSLYDLRVWCSVKVQNRATSDSNPTADKYRKDNPIRSVVCGSRSNFIDYLAPLEWGWVPRLDTKHFWTLNKSIWLAGAVISVPKSHVINLMPLRTVYIQFLNPPWPIGCCLFWLTTHSTYEKIFFVFYICSSQCTNDKSAS